MKVLVIEDDAGLAQQTARYLETRGIRITIASDGIEGQAEALRGEYECVILDLTLPSCDGIDVCRHLRSRIDVPIIIITGRDEEADVVLGLEVGADDYVTKPFSPRELLARIRAVVRRARARAGAPRGTVRVGRLVFDTVNTTVAIDDKPIDVTAYEFAILHALAQHPGKPVSRERLLQLAGGAADPSIDRSIDVHVSRLRTKLGDDSRNPRILKTVRGVGYLLVDL